MIQHLKSLFKIVLSIGLAAVFLWGAFQNVDWRLLLETLRNAKFSWLLLSGLLILLSCLPRAWRWQMLLAPVSRNISLWHAFKAVMLGYAGNCIFPRAGEVARAIALKKDTNLPLSAMLATVVVERILDMLTLLVFFGAVLFFARAKIASAFPGLESIGLIALPLVLLSLVFMGLLSAYGDRALNLLSRLLGRISEPLADRLEGILRAFLLGMGSVRTVSGYLEIAISTAVLNACYLMAIYLPFYSFDFPARYGLGLWDALVVMVIATVGVIIPTPGGTGTYHFFCSQTLHKFYGVPYAEALAFATAVHGITFVSFLVVGGPGFLHLLWGRKASHKPPPAD